MNQKNIGIKIIILIVMILLFLLYRGFNVDNIVEILLGVLGGFTAALIFEEKN